MNNLLISRSPDTNILPILVDYNLTQITPFVYVSAENIVRQYQSIFLNGINCLINVAYELPQIVFPPQSGIESLKYPIVDLPYFPAIRYFDIIADRIAANVKSNRRTLLYCHHGRSRSITFLLAYLIKYHHLSLSIAFILIKEKRKLALPNIGFWKQLKSYEFYQLQKNSYQKILKKISDEIEKIFIQNSIVNQINKKLYWRSLQE